VVAERVVANENLFFIGFVGNGQQINWIMDAPMGWQGPWLYKGGSPDSSKQGFREPFFTKVGEKRTIVILVRKAGFAVKHDGKIVYTYIGEWSHFKAAKMYSPESNTKSFFFGGNPAAKFKISQAVVTFPKD
jgi:hypothetical protein